MAFSPEILITAMAPDPDAVANAMMQSLLSIKQVLAKVAKMKV